jgi:zinc finger SWIM domain-containing protein 3
MCEFETRQKIPRLKNSYSDILQQMSELYTPTIFDLFQEQYELFEACIVKSMNIQTSSINYVIAMKKDLGEWQVDYDLEKKSICCSCRKFESFGKFCCHCLKVFIHMDVTSVPESYILKRWTKIARSGDLQTIGVSGVAQDLDLSPTQRYQKICSRYIRIITEGCRSSEAFMFLNEVADDLDEQMLKFQNMQISNDQLNETSNKVKEVASTNDGSTQVTRLAQKEGKRGSKRWKGWVQSKLAKRKKHSESNASQIKEHVVYFVLNI